MSIRILCSIFSLMIVSSTLPMTVNALEQSEDSLLIEAEEAESRKIDLAVIRIMQIKGLLKVEAEKVAEMLQVTRQSVREPQSLRAIELRKESMREVEDALEQVSKMHDGIMRQIAVRGEQRIIVPESVKSKLEVLQTELRGLEKTRRETRELVSVLMAELKDLVPIAFGESEIDRIMWRESGAALDAELDAAIAKESLR